MSIEAKLFLKRRAKIKVYIDGGENRGWSIDEDKKNILNYYDHDQIEIVPDWRKADIVHNLWWNVIFDTIPVFQEKRKKKMKVLVTCSNFIDFDLPQFNSHNLFNSVREISDGWLAPSRLQLSKLVQIGVKSYYLPLSINKSIFKPSGRNKEAICDALGIDRNVISGKVVIGSFQRDSLGNDLTKPKWQKGPKELVELIKDLPKEKFILLLAGPRRHYLINECKIYGIPYLYLGQESDSDDILENIIPIEKMPSLYSLTDIYLITSISEGGPKAAIEAAATKTFILSTKVGLAPDFITDSCIFDSSDEYKNTLFDLVIHHENNLDFIEKSKNINFTKYSDILNDQIMTRRLSDIYQQVLQ